MMSGFGINSFYEMMIKLGGVAFLLVLFSFFLSKNPMAKRLKSLNERRENLKSVDELIVRPRASLIQTDTLNQKIRKFLQSGKMLQESQVEAVQAKLLHAGIRNKEMAVRVILARMVLPIALGALVGVYVYVINAFPDWSALKRYMAVAGALIIGYKGPDIWLKNIITKRTTAIRLALPDALDLMVICAEAGLTVDATFARVGRELSKAYPELAEEYHVTSIELGFLNDRRTALSNLAARIDLEAVRGVVTTMIQTEKYGTPLAAALRTLSAEFRHDRMMRAEAKAARLPAIMTVPLILFILPVLFIVILGPAACHISDTLMKGS